MEDNWDEVRRWFLKYSVKLLFASSHILGPTNLGDIWSPAYMSSGKLGDHYLEMA